jgi:hypothetical protein
MEASLDALRRHVGPMGLVVWKIVITVCDEFHEK